jgi:murein L,D-transpeptidase YcbB/YkuD
VEGTIRRFWQRLVGAGRFVLGSSAALTLMSAAATNQLEQPALRLVVNVPAYRLDVYEGEQRIRSYSVTVGAPKYRTPRGTFAITRVEWNPWWIPPKSDWARDEKPTPPGWTNPVGRVKMTWRPQYCLHGTPFVTSLGSAQSHGCVRMANEDAMAVAKLIHAHIGPAVPADSIERWVADTSATRRIELAEPVPFEIRYDVTELRDGALLIHKDVYSLARGRVLPLALQTLAAGGVDTTQVDRTVLARAVRRAVRVSARVPLDSLHTRELHAAP